MIDRIKSVLFGLVVGDALGVPVEFTSREQLRMDPVKEMIGYGTWNQPPGTWSDDSSLSFCLAESLTEGYNLNTVAQNFIAWLKQGYWGAHHKVFDVGNATDASIRRLMQGVTPELAGGMHESDNGNGSLMRILPLLFYVKDLPVEERYAKVKELSSVTHAHFRSVYACFIYMEMALLLLKERNAEQAYSEMKNIVRDFTDGKGFNKRELDLFERILGADIHKIEESRIYTSGYVLYTLEASLWCLLNTDNYVDAVLKAVNLGGDTDTTACVTGGLAGLLYGYETIPKEWIACIARNNDIHDLSERLYKKLKIDKDKFKMGDQLKHISKFMSLVLRHKPEEIGLQLDEQGWASINELIAKMNTNGFNVSAEIINEVVVTNDKNRFAFNEDKTLIRASQGHSIEVDLNLQEMIPPDILYHGTTNKYLESILKEGLNSQSRQHVHLSATIETAKAVGGRHGKPVVLLIDAKSMYEAGFKFYLSENKVWLADAVPAVYISQ